MASSLLDELPCLLEEADELVARLGFYLKLLFSAPPSRRAHPSDQTSDPFVLRQQLASVDIEAIARSFSKHLLLVPTAHGQANTTLTDKLDALLPPADSTQRMALQTLAAKIFHLMKRVYQWQQTAWDETLLPLFMDSTSSRLAFDSHRALTTLVLDGVTKSVKLHLLWSSYANLSGLLVLHTFLEGKKKQPPAQAPTKDEDLHRVLDFVLYFGSNPLIKLQQELQQHPLAQSIASSLVELVLSCFDSYVGCHDLARLKHGGVLFEVDAAVVQGSYASSPMFHDLLVLPQLVEWVLCVALCLPQQWKAAPVRNTSWQLWDFVQLVAQDRLVIVVARDVVVNIHDLLFQQLTSALASSCNSHSNSPQDSLQPLKKALTRLSKRTVQSAGERRRERRVFVLWFLRDCVKLLRHNGALAAPLFPRVLAVLALARDEIEWLLAHGACVGASSSSGSYQPSGSKLLPNHVKAKHLERAGRSYTVDAAVFTELLSLLHELHTLLERERDCVLRYYMQFIARGDADAIATEIRSFLPSAKDDEAATPSPSARSSQLVGLLQGFADRRRFQLAPSDPGFASWRREWQQLSVHMLMAGEESVPTAVRALLDRACRHANYVQAFGSLLDRAGSRSKCCWFQDVLDQSLRDLLKAPARMGSADADNANWWVVAVVLGSLARGQTPIDELLESSEATHELARLLHRIELQNLVISESLQQEVDELVVQEERLHAKLSPLLVIERMGPKRVFKNGVSSSSKTAHKAATTLLLLTPGTESRLLATPDAAVETSLPLACARTRLTAVVSCLNHLATTLQAHDPTLLSLAELVKSSIQACIVRFLRQLVRETTGEDSRGLVLRVSWEDAARQWRAVVRCLQLQFQSVRRYVDISRLVETVCAAECVVDETVGAHSVRLLDRVLAFYASMLETKCIPKSKGHSGAALLASLSTCSYIVNPQSNQTAASLEASAYASPTAIPFLQEIVGAAGVQRLRDLVVKYLTKHAKTLFERLEKDKIALIRLKLAFPDDQSEIHMAVRIMDALDSGIVQEMLCVGNGVFFLRFLDKAVAADDPEIPRMAALRRTLWTQWGVQCSDGNSVLPSHVQAIWNLLPWAFVSVFHGSVWDTTSFLSELDATTTNVHLLAVAMQFLVDIFEPRGPQEKDKQDDDDAAAEEPQRRRERRRHVAYIASQAVLSLRRVAPELPTLAMVAVAKQLTRSLGVCGEAADTAEGATQHWLPDFVQEMTPRFA